jgi:hypothetical protein
MVREAAVQSCAERTRPTLSPSRLGKSRHLEELYLLFK